MLLTHAHRFRPAQARELVRSVLQQRLAGTTYNADRLSVLSKEIADDIKQRLKGTAAGACVCAVCSNVSHPKQHNSVLSSLPVTVCVLNWQSTLLVSTCKH